MAPMTPQQVLKRLKSLGDEKRRKHNAKFGAGENQFGVPMGEIRKLAKEIKTDHALAMQLWESGNVDARFLAVLCMRPMDLTAKELDGIVRSEPFTQVTDWLSNYVIKKHPEREALREKWMKAKDPLAARAGWSLTAGRVAREPEGLDMKALLDRIEKEMGKADPAAQWTMNTCLANIGIHHPKLRKRAISIGDSLGVFQDYPTSKGCISPFAPIWIEEMVKRQG